MVDQILHCVSSKHELINCLSSFDGTTAYLVIFGILFSCGLGVPMPEDIPIITSGILAALGKMTFTGALAASFLGVLAGDACLFFLGRKMGRRIFKVGFIARMMTEERIKKAEEKVISNSKFICFIARFLPGLRAPIYLTSGVMGVKPSVFLALDGLAALISVPVWVYVGYWLGDQWDENLEKVKELHIYLIGFVVCLVVGYFLYNKLSSSKAKA